MTPAKLYIARLSLFSPILGKQENGENKGKMGDYHACHDAINGMMASAFPHCLGLAVCQAVIQADYLALAQ